MCKIDQMNSLKDDINCIQELLNELNENQNHTIDTEILKKALETALDCMKHELDKLGILGYYEIQKGNKVNA